MPAKLPPTVVLEPVFVRDYERRLRLVMDLLEQELCQQHTPPLQHNQQMMDSEVQTNEDRRYLRPRQRARGNSKMKISVHNSKPCSRMPRLMIIKSAHSTSSKMMVTAELT